MDEKFDFKKIPEPPNPNERVVYFNCPPLKIELGDVSFPPLSLSFSLSLSLSLSSLSSLSLFLSLLTSLLTSLILSHRLVIK